MSPRRFLELIMAPAVCAVMSSCRRRQVRSYTIEKEEAGSVDGAVIERPAIMYDMPEGWVEEAVTTMRSASFSIAKDGLPAADLSVIPLEGTGGGLLPNVAQWRQQLGLAAIADEAMALLVEEVDAGENVFKMVDLTSTEARYDGGYKARMLAAYLQTGGHGWFFKLLGEDSLVGGEKTAFVGFLKSVRFPAP